MPRGGGRLCELVAALFNLLSAVFGILVFIGCTHNRAVLKDTYFLQVNVTKILDLPGFLGVLETDVQHALGIHDFYRYGLWGFCEGYNTTVVFCTPPKPGNATNPIDVINEELKHSHLPLPEAVETNVKRLQSASMFLFSCWIIGPAIGFFAAVAGVLIGCRTKGGGWIIGITAFISWIFIFLGCILSQVLYGGLRKVMSIADLGILEVKTTLGPTMFGFAWTSCACSTLALLLWVLSLGTRHFQKLR